MSTLPSGLINPILVISRDQNGQPYVSGIIVESILTNSSTTDTLTIRNEIKEVVRFADEALLPQTLPNGTLYALGFRSDPTSGLKWTAPGIYTFYAGNIQSLQIVPGGIRTNLIESFDPAIPIVIHGDLDFTGSDIRKLGLLSFGASENVVQSTFAGTSIAQAEIEILEITPAIGVIVIFFVDATVAFAKDSTTSGRISATYRYDSRIVVTPSTLSASVLSTVGVVTDTLLEARVDALGVFRIFAKNNGAEAATSWSADFRIMHADLPLPAP